MGFFDKLKQGLGKTKNSIDEKINNVFSVFRKVDEELLEELEEVLVMSDIGVETSVKIIDELRNKIKKEKIEDEEAVKKALKEIMKEILEVAKPNLNLETKVNKTTCIEGEISAIVQVLNNLIMNAIDAYKKQPGDINLKLSEDENKVYIVVEDFAGGIAEEVQDKLFKQMITTKGKNGTGLGLYMSYSNIKARFGGDITFETTEGKGTTFNIILPIKR